MADQQSDDFPAADGDVVGDGSDERDRVAAAQAEAEQPGSEGYETLSDTDRTATDRPAASSAVSPPVSIRVYACSAPNAATRSPTRAMSRRSRVIGPPMRATAALL